MSRIVAISSGKGGVGKTSLTANLAILLAQSGKKVLVMDGDTGLANLDVQLNVQPGKDLAHVIGGTATLSDVALPLTGLNLKRGSITLIPGRAGHAGLTTLSQPQLTSLLTDLRELAETYDLTLIDVAAGVTPAQLLMAAQADSTLLVTTPDPASLTDAYAFIKLLWQQHQCANARLVVNQATVREAKAVHTRLSTAAQNFLQLPPLPLLGNIPADRHYAAAVKTQQQAAIAFPHAAAVKALQDIVTQLA